MNVQKFIRSSIFLLSFQSLQAASANPFAHIAKTANSTPKSATPIKKPAIKKASTRPAIIPSKKIFSTQSAPASTAKQIPASYEQMIFVPTIPANSSLTATLETMYASTDIPLNTLQQLQQVYFVLEYFTKLEKIEHDRKYVSLKTKYASLITPVAHDIPFISSGMDLSTDSDWQNIKVTQLDIINSEMWQYFLKATIADIFVHNGNFLQVIHEVETQIFSYIPSMETSYYNSDFLSLRNLAEGTRLKLLLNDLIEKKHQAQCLDWAKLSSKQLQSASSSFQSTDFYIYSHDISIWMQQDSKGKLLSQKKVELTSPTKEQIFCYAMIKAAQNNLYAALAASDNVENFITQASSSSLLPNIFEYTLDEYVYLDDFFMIQANLATQIAENNPSTPTSSDAVHVQSLHDHPHKQKHKKRYKPEELVKVQSDLQYTIPAHAQLVNPAGAANPRILELQYVAAVDVDNRATTAAGFFNEVGNTVIDVYHSFISDAAQLGHNLKEDFIAAGYAIRDGFIQVGYAIRDAAMAAGEAIGGLGAVVIGDIANDPNLQKTGHHLTNKAISDLQQCGTELNSAIDDFCSAIKDGLLAPSADIDGALVGFILQDQSLGLDTHTIISQVADSLVDVAATLPRTSVGLYGGLAVDIVTLTTDLIDAIVKSVYAISYPNNGVGDAWSQLGYDMGTAILGAFDGLVNATKEIFAAIMQTLTYLTSAITTIIIDVSKEATFLFELAATGNLEAAKAEENSVNTYLDDHRQTIDMVSGIILAIAIDVAVTVATGGAGTAEAVVLTEGLMTGAEAGAEGGVLAAEAAATAARTAAKAAADAAKAAATEAADAAASAAEASTEASTLATQAAATAARNAAKAAADAAKTGGSIVRTGAQDAANAGKTAAQDAGTLVRTGTEDIGTIGSDTGTITTETSTTAASTAGETSTTAASTAGDTASTAGNAGKTAATTARETASTAEEAGNAGKTSTQNALDVLKTATTNTRTAATNTRTAATTARETASTARSTASKADQIASQAEAEVSQTTGALRTAANKADQIASQAEAEGSQTAGALRTAANKADQIASQAEAEGSQTAGALRTAANEADQTASTAEEAASTAESAATKAESAATKAEEATTKAEEAATKAESAAAKGSKWFKRGLTHVAISEGMNAAFNVLGAIGASYQDELSAVQEISQEEGVKNIVSYAMNNALNSSMQQNAMMQETEKKFNANLANQQIGLVMMQDFVTNVIVNASYQSEAVGLGQEYTSLLTPQPYDPSKPTVTYYPADIGSTWGLVTPINSLYPQLGLYTTTMGRSKFPYAQEIAQAPLVIDSQIGQESAVNIDGSSTTQAINQLWFNQRVMIPLSSQKVTDPLQVELHFRTIYSLETTTYTGLYLGGIFEDYRSESYLENLQTTGMANLNVAHLAKMFVLIHLPDGTVNIGLYEKDGLGNIKDPQGASWIVYEPLDKAFTTGWPIYDMKATLQNNLLTIEISRTDITTVAPWKKTVTVTPTDPRMLGIITSGTAIEWNILQPKTSIKQLQSIRTDKSSSPISGTEKDREINSLQTWAQLLTPTFGKFALSALSKFQCMNGNYVYTTINTGMKDSNNKPLTDYVVFANHDASGIAGVGLNPCANTTNVSNLVLVSLGTGNVFDTTGKIISNQKNAWDAYNKAHGPFASPIVQAITAMQAACLAALLKPIIGVFNLNAADSDMISKGLYVYTTTQTLTQNDQKNPITDYLITSTISNTTDLAGNALITLGDTFGAPPSGTTEGLLSLVTGNLYVINSLTVVNNGYDGLGLYQSSYQNLPEAITTKIANSLQAYTVATTPPTLPDQAPQPTPPLETQTLPTPPKPIISGSILDGNIANSIPASGGISFDDILGTPQVQALISAPASAVSITLQQQVASAGISFSMDLMDGPASDTSVDTSSNDQADQTATPAQTPPVSAKSTKKAAQTKAAEPVTTPVAKTSTPKTATPTSSQPVQAAASTPTKNPFAKTPTPKTTTPTLPQPAQVADPTPATNPFAKTSTPKTASSSKKTTTPATGTSQLAQAVATKNAPPAQSSSPSNTSTIAGPTMKTYATGISFDI